MTDWVIRLIDAGGLIGIFVLMLLETVFPPIPSEVIMPLAGMRAAHGQFGLTGVIVAGTLGAMAGNLFWYGVARAVGVAAFRGWIERNGRWLAMDWNDVERVRALFGRFGNRLVALGRLVPTIRSVISIPAGLVHMRLAPFLIFSTLGTAGWSALLAVAGYVLKARFAEVEQVAGPVSSVIVAMIVLLYTWRQLLWSRRNRDER